MNALVISIGTMDPFEVIAHECRHIVQVLTGMNMETWNPESGQSDPVTQLFFGFIARTTREGSWPATSATQTEARLTSEADLC